MQNSLTAVWEGADRPRIAPWVLRWVRIRMLLAFGPGARCRLMVARTDARRARCALQLVRQLAYWLVVALVFGAIVLFAPGRPQ